MQPIPHNLLSMNTDTLFRGLSFFAGILVRSDNPDLLTAKSKSGLSPWTIAFQKAGVPAMGQVVNVVLITAQLSSMNSAVYVASRTLVSLASSGRAPKFFALTTKNGTPVPALVISNGVGLIAMLNYKTGPGVVFGYLITISGSATFIAWAVIGAIHLRFRKAWRAQGYRVEDLPYRAMLFPYGTIFVIILNTFLVIIAVVSMQWDLSLIMWLWRCSWYYMLDGRSSRGRRLCLSWISTLSLVGGICIKLQGTMFGAGRRSHGTSKPNDSYSLSASLGGRLQPLESPAPPHPHPLLQNPGSLRAEKGAECEHTGRFFRTATWNAPTSSHPVRSNSRTLSSELSLPRLSTLRCLLLHLPLSLRPRLPSTFLSAMRNT